MTDSNLSEDARREIFERDIVPLYFPPGLTDDEPALVLLAAQPGAGRARAAAALVAESGGTLSALNGDDLRAFHPDAAQLVTSGSRDAVAALDRVTASWVGAGIRYAREHRRSLLLDGTFPDPAVVAATAERFADVGFSTRVVVIGSRRAESLLTATSRYLRDVQAGVPARFTSREAHESGLDATRVLVAALEAAPFADRLTVLDRGGRTVFDGQRSDGESAFTGARDALLAAQSMRMGRLDATQWLSELHHVTEFAASRRDLPMGVTEALVDLHETALREVIPELHVPIEGRFATMIEQRTVARLVALRRDMQRDHAQPDVAAPILVPRGPDRDGPTR
ncbi:zeta toxin family protein [Microbacterium sp.]|uniref:zeta toxin family protein n=1 Tax=Microbacterium sp. TaxID=51671 RepID=UPI003A8F6584